MVLSAAAAATAEIPLVIPDAGPWITLAYADALHLLEAPGCIKVTTPPRLAPLPGTSAADCFRECDREASDPGGPSVLQTSIPT